MPATSAQPRFEHQRHKPPAPLVRLRPLVIAMPQLRSAVNLSRIIRTAGCCGVQRVIACGSTSVDKKITRHALEQVHLEKHRSLPPVLKSLKSDGYQLVGLEQTTNSESLFEFPFQRRTALILGHERLGLTDDALEQLDRVVEIPIFGLPHSYNVATAAAMTMYEYCRQFPEG